MSSGRLSGSISGGRQDRASYVPDIYARTQNNWVDSFYKQNGYLGMAYIIFIATTWVEHHILKRHRSFLHAKIEPCYGGFNNLYPQLTNFLWH